MGKKPHGHYCRICQQYKANEKFSGRGHNAHICKACASRGNRPPAVELEPPIDKADASAFIDFDVIDGYGFAFDVFSDEFDLPVTEVPKKPKKKRKPSKEKLLRAEQKKHAKAFLNEIFANGDVSKAAIMEASSKAGIPIDALRRAKGSLGIRSVATEEGSVWKMPRQNIANEEVLK